MGQAKAVAFAVLGSLLAIGCGEESEEDLELRYGSDTDFEGSSTGDDGSASWTSAGPSSTSWTGGSSSSTGGGSSSTGGGSSSTGGGTSTGGHIPLVMQDFEYANVGEDDDPWPVDGTNIDVFPSVPGCIEVYQYTCEGHKKGPWLDTCMISGDGGFLRDFYTDPECVPFQQPKQEVVSCDEFCGDGGGSCEYEQIYCGVGIVQSAYCKC